MNGYAQTIIIGNVGKAPELTFTPSQKAVVSFSVAVNRKWGDNETTVWYTVEAWEKKAEVINQYVKLGDTILLVGRMAVDKWDGDDGKKHERWKLVVSDFTFMGGKRQGTNEAAGAAATTGQVPHPAETDGVPHPTAAEYRGDPEDEPPF